jgi:flagellar protein FliO/FliZ
MSPTAGARDSATRGSGFSRERPHGGRTTAPFLRRARAPAFVIAGFLTVAPAFAAATPSPGVDAGALVRLIVGLVAVIGVILLLSWSLRRFGGLSRSAGGQLQVLASVAVGHRERVVLLQVGEQQLLLGIAPGRVQTLHVLDKPLEGGELRAARDVQASPFADRLRRLMQQQHEKR